MMPARSALCLLGLTAAGCYAGHHADDDDHSPGGDGDADADGEPDGDADADSDGDVDGDGDSDVDVDSDADRFVPAGQSCDGQSCEGRNLTQAGLSAGASCRNLHASLDVEVRVANCGTVEIDREVEVVIRIGDPEGRDIVAGAVPAGLPPGMGFDLVLPVPWTEWRPRKDGTPVFVVIDAAGSVNECNEDDDVIEATQIGC
jgi:hypothetical protein